MIVIVALAGLTPFFAAGWLFARIELGRVRNALHDAYDARDGMERNLNATQAKAEYLAEQLRAAVLSSCIPEEDAYLMDVEADMDPELFGLAETLAAFDPKETP